MNPGDKVHVLTGPAWLDRHGIRIWRLARYDGRRTAGDRLYASALTVTGTAFFTVLDIAAGWPAWALAPELAVPAFAAFLLRPRPARVALPQARPAGLPGDSRREIAA